MIGHKCIPEARRRSNEACIKHRQHIRCIERSGKNETYNLILLIDFDPEWHSINMGSLARAWAEDDILGTIRALIQLRHRRAIIRIRSSIPSSAALPRPYLPLFAAHHPRLLPMPVRLQSRALCACQLTLGAASWDFGFLRRLGPVNGAASHLPAEGVRFHPDSESLVRFLESTPRERLLEDIAQKIRSGLT